MRAPENGSRFSRHSMQEQRSGGGALVSPAAEITLLCSRLRWFSTFTLTRPLLLFLIFKRLCAVESDAAASQCHIRIFI